MFNNEKFYEYTEKFIVDKEKATYARALSFCLALRKEQSEPYSLLLLDQYLDKDKIANRDIFESGVKLAIDGWDSSLIEKILTNWVNAAARLEPCREKEFNMQKEAAWCVSQNMNPHAARIFLQSHFPDIQSLLNKLNAIYYELLDLFWPSQDFESQDHRYLGLPGEVLPKDQG